MNYNKLKQVIEEVENLDFSKFKELIEYIQKFQAYLDNQKAIIKQYKEELYNQFSNFKKEVKEILKADILQIKQELLNNFNTKYEKLLNDIQEEFKDINDSIDITIEKFREDINLQDKKIEELEEVFVRYKENIEEALDKNYTYVSNLNKEIEELKKSFTVKMKDVENKFEEKDKKINSLKKLIYILIVFVGIVILVNIWLLILFINLLKGDLFF